jgi:hypothetical protein
VESKKIYSAGSWMFLSAMAVGQESAMAVSQESAMLGMIFW